MSGLTGNRGAGYTHGVILPMALLAAALAARAESQRDPREVPWSSERYTKEEIEGSRELKAIQERVDRGELPKVQFDFDSDKIRPESFSTLSLIADYLLKHPHLKLRVTAHTCTIGTKDYNVELSLRRAKSVKTYLVKQGVPPPSIRFRGAGFAEPIADNSTEEGRRKNRRVEFRITTRDWESVY